MRLRRKTVETLKPEAEIGEGYKVIGRGLAVVRGMSVLGFL